MESVFVEGKVTRGRKLGRTLGFPTANIVLDYPLDVPDGVYRSRVWIEERVYDGMSNLGCNPSVGGCTRRLETYIFDFDGLLYDRMIRVELVEKIREEQCFDSMGALRRQIEEDRIEILRRIRS